jgi:hypothetical protein
MNFECTWPSDPTFAVDLADPAAWRHVLDDIRVAEELEIRYGDRVAGLRPVSVFGVVFRRGAGADLTLARRLRTACSATLFKAIADAHAVTTEDIAGIRARLADKGADLPVSIPMALFCAWLSLRTIRWIRGRFDSDERVPTVVALLLASAAVSAAVVLVVQLWATAVEIVRIGNEHLSYRAGRRSWVTGPAALPFGMVIFWLLAAIQLRTRKGPFE